ncbi:MAG: response regulator transcription factor [Leptolinea sp.]|jgi:DNA-binding NarL/FixJ family response regulator|nr:response regulator transcription factor [Leptolinea sp.]
MIKLMLVEDNLRLRAALKAGFEATGQVKINADTGSGEDALEKATTFPPDAVLMDVHLEGSLNGIQAAAALRREIPRLPVVFYSIQDDDQYYRDFRASGIISHYAYVRKSNYLLPELILPLIQDAIAGRSFIDPEIEERVHEVHSLDEQNPLALLEPNELEVIKLIAQGLTNEQIASRMGFHDKRTISRTNGSIYAAWGLDETSVDEKVARTRAAIIFQTGRLIHWNEGGQPFILDREHNWIPWEGE